MKKNAYIALALSLFLSCPVVSFASESVRAHDRVLKTAKDKIHDKEHEHDTPAKSETVVTSTSTVKNSKVTEDAVKAVVTHKKEKKDKKEVMPTYKHLPENAEAFVDYHGAAEYFYAGLNCTDMAERKENLAKAVELIADSYGKEKDAVNTLFLASRIYRAYGGISYAKSYYEKAIHECADCLTKTPDCRQAFLDLAVLSHAGDSYFYNDREEYEHRAQMYANKVIEEINELRKPDGRAFFQAALANIVLEKNAEAAKLMKKAIEAGYIENEEYKAVCEDFLKGEFKLLPVKEENRGREFLAYSFGEIAK